jgi:hypothetical protein
MVLLVLVLELDPHHHHHPQLPLSLLRRLPTPLNKWHGYNTTQMKFLPLLCTIVSHI